MNLDFEDYLQMRHADGYRGTDDDMVDAYEAWLGELDADEWMELGNEFAEWYQYHMMV